MFKDDFINYMCDIAPVEVGEPIRSIIITNSWNETFINMLASGLFTLENMLYTMAVFHRVRFDYEEMSDIDFTLLMQNVVQYYSTYPDITPEQFVHENLAVKHKPINFDPATTYDAIIGGNLLNFSNSLILIMILYRQNPEINVEDALTLVIEHFTLVKNDLVLCTDDDNCSTDSEYDDD